MLKNFKQLPTLLAQTAIVLLISLVLTEVAFRIYNKINPSFVFYDSSYNRFRGRPYADDYQFQLNSQGFKDVEFERQKADGTYRILGIGDSFAFGVVPYQYNYYTRLEDKLNKRGGQYEVINMGIPNLGPKDYFSIFLNEGLELNPDMVILSFFIGNDFLDRQAEPRNWYSYSYVASFVKFIIDLQKTYEGQVIHGKYEYQDAQETFDDAKFLDIQTQRSVIFSKQDPNFQENLDYSVSYLEKMKEICDRKNIKFLVVIIPDETQVNPALQNQVLQSLNVSSAYYDFDLPNRLLAAELAKRDIEYLDLLDRFKTTSATQLLYKPNDTHWNIAGNELAASEIRKSITNP